MLLFGMKVIYCLSTHRICPLEEQIDCDLRQSIIMAILVIEVALQAQVAVAVAYEAV